MPIIGICGSITPLNGIMTAYVVDSLPTKHLISAFIKLISIYGGAGIVSSIFVYIIVGNITKNALFGNEHFTINMQVMVFRCRIYLILTILIGFFQICLFTV
eukprot:TRINITY_DN5891_c0_g1_i1.p1 TRINITY_DN5891_c0_g1~~TRINITY_DN5891_c0_g1_i1.p1  ORF type:complete len:102 (+),score=8.29 TRINITY_DN5891_c0_g1_i1:315-620(+)